MFLAKLCSRFFFSTYSEAQNFIDFEPTRNHSFCFVVDLMYVIKLKYFFFFKDHQLPLDEVIYGHEIATLVTLKPVRKEKNCWLVLFL